MFAKGLARVKMLTRPRVVAPAALLCLVLAVPAFGQPATMLPYIKAVRLFEKLDKDPGASREKWSQLVQSFCLLHKTEKNRAISERSLLLAGRASLAAYRRHGNLDDLDSAIRYLGDFTKVHRNDRYFIQGLKELKAADTLRRKISDCGRDNGFKGHVCPIADERPSRHIRAAEPSYRAGPRYSPASENRLASKGNWNRPAYKYTGNPFWTPRNASLGHSSGSGASSLGLAAVADLLPDRAPSSTDPPKPEAGRFPEGAASPTNPATDLVPQSQRQPAVSDPVRAPHAQPGHSPVTQVVASVVPSNKPEHETKKKSEYSGNAYVVAIDPGHGGRDPGAVSSDGTLKEKDLTLDVAKRLKTMLEKSNPGITAALTRSDDRFMTLEERSAAANALNADLFISIHCNSDTDSSSHGTETYYLSKATSSKAMRAAARENGLSMAKMTDLQATLLDLMVTSKKTESEALASAVSNSLEQVIPKGRHRGVKQAPFYVLLGAKMPAILVECAFISNSRECHKLHDPKYLDTIAHGLSNGAQSYLRGLGN